jgi:hypothetical protein
MERSCDENGLKRRQSRRLGPWYVSFFFPFAFYDTN